jgi:ribonucleoside-diphosphate reductase alpha chain
MTDTNTAIGDVVSATFQGNKKQGDYLALNSLLNIWGPDGKIQFDKDKEAVRAYFLEHVNPSTVFFHDLEEKLNFLVENDYYEKEFLEKYEFAFVKKLFKTVYDKKFRFPTFVGAYKYYTSYTLKTFDGKRYLERFEDRVTIAALYLADGDKKLAENIAEEIISGRFQPATPTFLNAGKAQRGELVSCFLLNVDDDLNSILRSVNSSGQLSKRGGGVALALTNLRAKGDPIKKIENQASGVVPVMKLLEDTFSYANQLGARQGAGAVYLNAHHPDIMEFLDTKRENADEKIRIKTLSLGVVIPDITFELAKNNEDMYLFSPYDVERVYGKQMAYVNISENYRAMVDNPDIRKKKISPREFLSTLAEIQMESGYPYIMFEDAANRANPIDGKIIMSNLCSEILQVQEPSHIEDDQTYSTLGKDISCNLGSLNVRKALQSPDFGKTIETSIRVLTQVSDMSDIVSVPTVAAGNRRSHAIGLGAMNLHGTFGYHHMYYGDEESLDLTNMYFSAVTYYALLASNKIAKERKETFVGFEKSAYADGSYLQKFIDNVAVARTEKVKAIFADIATPTKEDWEKLSASIQKHGIYNQNLQAVPPTGSISYLANATASIHGITSKIEARKEGKLGTVRVPAAEMNNDNIQYYEDAYEIGYKKLMDVYAIAGFYVDQGLSLTLFFKESATTRDLNMAYLYAFGKGKGKPAKDEREAMVNSFNQGELKTIYYIRVQQQAITGTSMEECVSCAL